MMDLRGRQLLSTVDPSDIRRLVTARLHFRRGAASLLKRGSQILRGCTAKKKRGFSFRAVGLSGPSSGCVAPLVRLRPAPGWRDQYGWAIGPFTDDRPDKADALCPAFPGHGGGDRAGMLVGDTEPAVPAAEPFLRLPREGLHPFRGRVGLRLEVPCLACREAIIPGGFH